MANKYKGETAILVSGEEYILKYDLNALAEISDRLETNGIDEVFEHLEKMDFKTIRLLLWAGVLHQFMDEHDRPTISQREVGAWDISLVEAGEKIGEALKLSMGVTDEQIENAEKLQAQAELHKVANQGKKTKATTTKKK